MQTQRKIQHSVFISVFLFCLSLSFAVHGQSANIYGRLKAVQCDSLIKANETNPNFVILDVRTPGEWNNYHIMGSINRSTGLSDFTSQLDALPKHKIFLLHCQSGGKSAVAFQKMKDLEYAEVYEMIGGINAWNAAGLPTTTVTQPKLMLVNYESISGEINDTLKVTITNRANGMLSFTSANIDDLHSVSDNFNLTSQIQGAFDYTFSIIHSMHYTGDDSTQIMLASNGGELDLNVVFKNGIIQGIQQQPFDEPVVYPNPARDRLFVKNIDPASKLSILNIQGQPILIKEGFETTNGINVNGLKNGFYILQIRKEGRTVVKKFVVRH